MPTLTWLLPLVVAAYSTKALQHLGANPRSPGLHVRMSSPRGRPFLELEFQIVDARNQASPRPYTFAKYNMDLCHVLNQPNAVKQTPAEARERMESWGRDLEVLPIGDSWFIRLMVEGRGVHYDASGSTVEDRAAAERVGPSAADVMRRVRSRLTVKPGHDVVIGILLAKDLGQRSGDLVAAWQAVHAKS
jgi:hypothetical protein